MASDNRTLGRFHLDGIPPAPRGIPKIEVTFDIDANGILHVSAKDMGTGKQQQITITGHSGLDEKEIKRMVSDAEAHSTEDKKRRETIDARNQADQMIYSLEKILRENADKIPAAEAEAVRAEIEATKKAVESDGRGHQESPGKPHRPPQDDRGSLPERRPAARGGGRLRRSRAGFVRTDRRKQRRVRGGCHRR